jgi:uncharacterized protein (DUF2147 family)
MRQAIAGLALTFVLAGGDRAHAADPTGTWLVEDRNGIVQIGDCGVLAQPGIPALPPSPPTGSLCGVIVWLKDPLDPATGKPPVDKNNADPAKRGVPMMGLKVFSDMAPSRAPDRWDGRVYNLDDGKTYDGSLIMQSDTALRIQGCLLFICQGENWTRQALPAPTAPPQPRAR